MEKAGILLELGDAGEKDPRFVRLCDRPGPGVDYVHSLEEFPYPFAGETCLTVLAKNVLEHVKPWLTVQVFNELWRILVPGGQLAVAVPYAGSPPFWQDPTHCNGFTEMTFYYFVKAHPLWEVYRPSPWKIASGFPVWQMTGILEAVLVKDAE